MKILDSIKAIFTRNKIILNIIIIVIVNLVSATLFFKLDVTSNNSYSLSPMSKEVVSSLADPLNVKLFFSKKLPAPYNTVDRYLRDLMEEYADAGNKYFNYEYIDVDSEKEDVSAEFGIYQVQVREVESDELKFRNVYMGMAFVHGDLIEKIPRIENSEGLEYQITSTIRKMTGKIDTLLKLEEPIKVTLYASSNIPLQGVNDLEKKVSNIVKKVKVENYNKVEFSVVDTVKDPQELAKAEGYGVTKVNWPAIPANRSFNGKSVTAGEGLIGILVELNGNFEHLQLISRTIFGQYGIGNLENLQENINKAIDNIINVNPSIGYITGHMEVNINDSNEGAGNMNAMLSDMYDLKEIDLTKEDIPDDLNMIMVNGPKQKFSDYELYKIDQFLMKGKSGIFLIDSFNEIRDQQTMRLGGGQPIVLPVDTGLNKLLMHYGISVNKDIVLDEKCYKATQQGMGSQDIYFIPIIEQEGLNPDNEITEYLNAMFWSKGSSVKFDSKERPDLVSTVLVSSSEKSWLMEGRVNFMPFGMSPPSDKSKLARRNLAVMVQGKLTSYFMDKEIPEPSAPENNDLNAKNKSKTPEQKKEPGKTSAITSTAIIDKAVKPSKIIVTGTSEITLSSMIDNEGKSLNAVFLHNALDYLSDVNNTQEMRSKGIRINPIKDSGEKFRFFIKIFNIAGLPVLVIIAGLVIWRLRIKRKKRIMEEFAG